jgi:vacuolar protein sorting-associated protein 52
VEDMWLDRLSSHSTPSGSPPPPANRAYSPATRRPSHLAPSSAPQRPGFSPRSSSLSLASNDSTTSLLASSRKPNGSGLRQSSIVPDVTDPLEVLEKLLGPEREGLPEPAKTAANGLVDESDPELDFGGLSLQEVIAEEDSKEETVYNAQTIEECMEILSILSEYLLILILDQNGKEKFEDLHRSIRACDDVLDSVEINLTSFRNDLAAVSAEIETLQARSTALSVRLENRKLVEHGLGPMVEEISVSPAVIKKIVDGTIDEAWVRALGEVEKRSKAMDAKSKELRTIKGIDDLKPLLENLIAKVGFFIYSLCSVLIPSRPSKGSETSSLHRSRRYGRRISTLKLSSSSTLFDTKTSTPFCTGIIRS